MGGWVGRGEESVGWGVHKLPGPVSCYWVTDVLLTSAVAFYTDLDRYTCVRTERRIMYKHTYVCTLMHD